MTKRTAPPAPAQPPATAGAAARARAIAPGLLLCLLGAVLAWAAARALAAVVPAASPMLLAIVIGVLAANLRPIPAWADAGLAFSSRTVLRLGVVLLGFSIAIGDVVALGPGVLAVILAVVAAGLLTGIAAGRVAGLSREQALLTAAGCSICGAAAVAGVDGVLRRRRAHETATAVAVVVLFGTAMIALGPVTAHLAGLDDHAAGVFIGGATHEVAQVVAAGGIAGSGVLTAAVIVKLARVLLLAPVLALLGLAERRAAVADAAAGAAPAGSRPALVPAFVLGFIAAVAARSALPLPAGLLAGLEGLRTWAFLIAMVALGTGVRRDTLAAAGWAPFLHGLAVTAVVFAVALGGALLL
ncbi:YeiH family protein [Corynebacterium sphenisci]|uniref:YeiH family protein n=1 Tax=Corynebacterium sphenisci TaxID=191493 RepID=UPI0026E09FB0|nr:putative sulfate exporter family transporter [Corynebacterium sphenisci]MDO5731558.1 putative sulfate exporter family transporter [Corynebacterium sphenisci]